MSIPRWGTVRRWFAISLLLGGSMSAGVWAANETTGRIDSSDASKPAVRSILVSPVNEGRRDPSPAASSLPASSSGPSTRPSSDPTEPPRSDDAAPSSSPASNEPASTERGTAAAPRNRSIIAGLRVADRTEARGAGSVAARGERSDSDPSAPVAPALRGAIEGVTAAADRSHTARPAPPSVPQRRSIVTLAPSVAARQPEAIARRSTESPLESGSSVSGERAARLEELQREWTVASEKLAAGLSGAASRLGRAAMAIGAPAADERDVARSESGLTWEMIRTTPAAMQAVFDRVSNARYVRQPQTLLTDADRAIDQALAGMPAQQNWRRLTRGDRTIASSTDRAASRSERSSLRRSASLLAGWLDLAGDGLKSAAADLERWSNEGTDLAGQDADDSTCDKAIGEDARSLIDARP